MKARESERNETVLYRKYLTDSLFVSAQNQRLTKRYSELVQQMYAKPVTKDGDEIAADVIARLGLKLMKGGKQ